MKEFTRACAQRDIVIPGLDPLERKAPCPRRYTFVSVPSEYPLRFAFAASDLRTAGDRGLADLRRLGAAFLLRVVVLRLLRTAIGFSYSFAHEGARKGPGAQCFKAVDATPEGTVEGLARLNASLTLLIHRSIKWQVACHAHSWRTMELLYDT